MTAGRLDPKLTAAALLGLAFMAAFALDVGDPRWQLLVDLTIAGMVVGGIFALSAAGLVVTYTSTGVFNFSHGAIAVFVAYVLWQFVRVWDIPIGIAAPLALLVVGPGVGVALELAVFRPLQRRGATGAELIVASLGVFVLLVGASFLIWGPETKNDPVRLFSGQPFRCGGEACRIPGTDLTFTIGIDQFAVILIVAVLTTTLWLVLARTWLGTRIRAVVDDRTLAELSAVDAGRVAAVSWAVGAGLAGLTGVLLAPITFGLDPFRLTLLVTETFAVAVLARLVSLPLTLGGGLFVGLLLSYASAFTFARPAELFGASDELADSVARLFDPVLTSVSVFVLFATLLLNRGLREVGGDDRGFFRRVMVGGTAPGRWSRELTVAAIVVALAAPVAITPGQWRDAHTMLALIPILLSIVVMTGYSGHITLGQAGFAGFGAFLTGRLHAGSVLGLPALPLIPAMIVAALACAPLGLAAGIPAVRRRGLFLGLTTLALGLVLERYVFQNFYLVSPDVMDLGRPSLFGLSFESNAAFWWFELAVVGVAVLLARWARRGRLGRMLAAIRDSEPAAASVGIDVRRTKLFVFSLGALMAGLGGALLGQTAQAFSPDQFISFNSLIWFAAIVVAGVTTIAGAVVGAFVLTMLGAYLGEPGLSIFLIGAAALALGHLPGGLVGAARRFTVLGWAPASLIDTARRARSDASQAPAGAAEAEATARLELTPLGRRLVSEGRR